LRRTTFVRNSCRNGRNADPHFPAKILDQRTDGALRDRNHSNLANSVHFSDEGPPRARFEPVYRETRIPDTG